MPLYLCTNIVDVLNLPVSHGDILIVNCSICICYVAAAKPVLDDLVVGIDRTSSQLLLFDDSCKKSSLKVPLEIMAEHPGLNFRSNLLDCHVDICSPELMLQFSDNFDYQVQLVLRDRQSASRLLMSSFFLL
jgi:hypothetical protein